MKRSRHILVRGLQQDIVTARLRHYAELAEPGPADDTWHIVDVPDSPWVVVTVPERPHVWHFHNLAVWMLGTEADHDVPAEVSTLSRSDAPHWDYALYTQGSVVLRGHQGDGTPMMVHVPDGTVRRGQPVDLTFVAPSNVCLEKGFSGKYLDEIPSDAVAVTLRLSDPGAELNPELKEEKPPGLIAQLKSLLGL